MNSFLKSPKTKKHNKFPERAVKAEHETSAKISWMWVIISWLIFLGLVFTSGYLYFTGQFTIKKVVCRLDQDGCPDYVEAELNKIKGKFLFSDEVNAQVERIGKYLPSLNKYQIQRQFPDTVRVTFFPSPPEYILTDDAQASWVVDESGTIIDQKSATELPHIQVTQAFMENLQLRGQIDPTLHQAIMNVVGKLTEYGIEFRSISYLQSDELKVTLQDDKVVEIPIVGADVAMEKLRLVLRGVDFSHFHQPVRTIDVRFKYPILKE
jgi:cell division septal protein FtsQ